VVRQLLRRGIGKRIRVDGPSTHLSKSGTATMGGLYFLSGISVITGGLALGGYAQGLLPVVSMLGYGVLGAFDDVRGLKDVEGTGWLARYKFPVQVALAIALALTMLRFTDAPPLILPISGRVVDLGAWAVPVAAALIITTSNAVNLADGLDGLAAGAAAIAFLAYGVITGLSGQTGLSFFCFALVGVLLAFLWFNVHPARMFMGDVGSEALGAGLAVVAMLSGHWLLLPIIGVVFVGEAVSVILQVSYFKATRRKYGEGRRVFRMSPLHHHFEMVGWTEEQITSRFWLVAAVAAAAGVGMGMA